MNWEAIGAFGEIIGALAVVATLIYLATQVRYAKQATADQNRLVRANGVREMALVAIQNDELRESLDSNWAMNEIHERLAEENGTTRSEASRANWANSYYFWLHWGQWASTHSDSDRAELANLIRNFYTLPGIRRSWETSAFAKPMLDPEFVDFVDDILKESE